MQSAVKAQLLLLCFVFLVVETSGRDNGPGGGVAQRLEVTGGYPSWSPDGNKLLFYAPGVGGKPDLFVQSKDGTVRQLTQTDAREDEPTWSPDGKSIAFVSDRDGNPEIYVMDADGSNQRRLTGHGLRDVHPRFLPGGQRILFNRENREEGSSGAEIWEMTLRGDGLRRIARDSQALLTYASPSPRDGSLLHVRWFRVSGGPPNTEIFLMEADGTNPRQLTQHSGADGWPAWSPDGKRICFASDRSGALELYLMNPEGQEVIRLTTDGAQGGYRRPAWSPDGSRIVTNRGESEIFVVAVP